MSRKITFAHLYRYYWFDRIKIIIMKTEFVEEIIFVADSKLNLVDSTSWVANSERIFVNYWLVLFSGNLTSLKDDNLNRLPVIEY